MGLPMGKILGKSSLLLSVAIISVRFIDAQMCSGVWRTESATPVLRDRIKNHVTSKATVSPYKKSHKNTCQLNLMS
jgi:hypothetical protein